MVKTVDPRYLTWHAKTIPRRSDFRGVLLLGLLAAWFFFLWRVLSLPAFSAIVSSHGALLRSALDKGQFMPDFGVIIAGFGAFHFRREFQTSLDIKVAIPSILMVIATLIAPLVVAIALLDAVHLASGHAILPPWRDPLIDIQFRVIIPAAILVILLPRVVFQLWTGIPDSALAGVVLAGIFYGMTFTLHSYRLEWMWPARVVAGGFMGVALSAALFRAIEYLSAVRPILIILGVVTLIGGSILAGPPLFFVGFLMLVSGFALSERTSMVPGEAALLGWSRTAYAIVLTQPAVLAAWLAWGGGWAPSLGLLAVLALATQVLAVLLFLLVERPVGAVLLRRIPIPIK